MILMEFVDADGDKYGKNYSFGYIITDFQKQFRRLINRYPLIR